MTDARDPGLDAALFGHGLGRALRAAARRQGDGLHTDTIARLATGTRALAQRPDAALPSDDARAAFAFLLSHTDAPDAAAPEPPKRPPDATDRDWQAVQAQGKGLFALLRAIERASGDKPRIGRNRRLRDAPVTLGQDPYLGFAIRDVARYDPQAIPPMVRAQVLGFFGPFGAFPMAWTEEAMRWFGEGDESFTAFVDIFATRFIELFYRAWADTRAIAQFDHPSGDRFRDYLLSTVGTGTPAMQDRDRVPDTVKLRFAGLAGARVKSAARLRQMLGLHFDGIADISIDELVPTWLAFEPEALTRVGMQGASLGRDMHLGSRVRTLSEKLRLNVSVQHTETYFRFLPGGDLYTELSDLVFWYLGLAQEIEIALWLPQPAIRPAIVGAGAQLGWMACIAPPAGDPARMVRATAYTLAPPVPQQDAQPRDRAA